MRGIVSSVPVISAPPFRTARCPDVPQWTVQTEVLMSKIVVLSGNPKPASKKRVRRDRSGSEPESFSASVVTGSEAFLPPEWAGSSE